MFLIKKKIDWLQIILSKGLDMRKVFEYFEARYIGSYSLSFWCLGNKWTRYDHFSTLNWEVKAQWLLTWTVSIHRHGAFKELWWAAPAPKILLESIGCGAGLFAFVISSQGSSDVHLSLGTCIGLIALRMECAFESSDFNPCAMRLSWLPYKYHSVNYITSYHLRLVRQGSSIKRNNIFKISFYLRSNGIPERGIFWQELESNEWHREKKEGELLIRTVTNSRKSYNLK